MRAIALSWILCSIASAQAQPLPRQTEIAELLDEASEAQIELALGIARVAVNEASLSDIHPPDVALIAQVTFAHGETPEAQLAWLERHSSCVLGDRTLRPREMRSNCPWSRNLPLYDDEAPEGWPSDVRWDVYVERWRRVRRLALLFVLGRAHTPFPCRETPRTWGSPRLDHAQALRRGLRRVECVGSHNWGYVLAR